MMAKEVFISGRVARAIISLFSVQFAQYIAKYKRLTSKIRNV